MSKIFNNIIDNCVEKLSNDENIKNKLEKDIINPAIIKAYSKLKPYMFVVFYMYGIIVLLQLVIILLLIFKKK